MINTSQTDQIFSITLSREDVVLVQSALRAVGFQLIVEGREVTEVARLIKTIGEQCERQEREGAGNEHSDE